MSSINPSVSTEPMKLCQQPDKSVNKENIETLINLIKKHRDHFEMNLFGYLTLTDEYNKPFMCPMNLEGTEDGVLIPPNLHMCGTSGCIAGFIDSIYQGNATSTDCFPFSQSRAMFLGLTEDQCDLLFYSSSLWDDNADKIGIERKYYNTGEVRPVALDDITADHAINMLRLIQTGEILVQDNN